MTQPIEKGDNHRFKHEKRLNTKVLLNKEHHSKFTALLAALTNKF